MSRAIGEQYERLACDFLITNGCQIIANNYTVANVGEIDIVARLDKTLPNGRTYPTLLCVEVRARRHKHFASAVETVTKAKQKRLIATMSHFLQSFEIYKDFDIRFDVIAIDIRPDDDKTVWLQGAFLANE